MEGIKKEGRQPLESSDDWKPRTNAPKGLKPIPDNTTERGRQNQSGRCWYCQHRT